MVALSSLTCPLNAVLPHGVTRFLGSLSPGTLVNTYKLWTLWIFKHICSIPFLFPNFHFFVILPLSIVNFNLFRSSQGPSVFMYLLIVFHLPCQPPYLVA